ncbi:hypothetical protein LWI28_027545 [Acer negundo]|uniref:Uncharacterized protein n=1 Tax=Acer negundo TaxID=4023 RepID=A0AAD5IHL8_ACENE|nr:hypothetical protein LWI28_027545 [Acer negundo]
MMRDDLEVFSINVDDIVFLGDEDDLRDNLKVFSSNVDTVRMLDEKGEWRRDDEETNKMNSEASFDKVLDNLCTDVDFISTIHHIDSSIGKGVDIVRVDVESVPFASFPSINTTQYDPPNASFSFSNIRTPEHKTFANKVVDISSDEEVNINAHIEAREADVYNEDDEEYNPYENGLLYKEET